MIFSRGEKGGRDRLRVILTVALILLIVGFSGATITSLVLNDSTDLIAGWMNRTSVGSLGAGLDGPVLFMDFNKDADGTSIRDNSINNNFGTNNGATWNSSCGVTDAGNDLGGCFEFDGVNDYINLTTGQFTKGQTQLSIGAWINLDDVSDIYIILSEDTTGSTNNRYSFVVTSTGEVRIAGRDDDTDSFTVFAVSGTGEIVAGQWYYITGVFDADTDNHKVYKDGVDVTLTSSSGEDGFDDTVPSTSFIGKNSPSSGKFFNGSIDNVQIFDRALSATEIQNLYNGSINNTDYYGKYSNEGNFTSPVFYNSTSTYWNVTQSIADSDYIDTLDYVNTSGLVSYWRLDGDVNDSVGGNDGTNSGSNDTVGIVGHGRDFVDTESDYVNLGDVSSYDGLSNFTVGSWVYLDSYSGGTYYLSKWKATGDERSWALQVDADGDVYFYTTSTGAYSNPTNAYFVLSDYKLSLNKWYHIVGEFEEGVQRLYINGELNAEGDNSANYQTIHPGSADFLLGARGQATPDLHLDGSIDEVLIFNRSLSSTEISEIYDEQKKYYGIDMFEEYGVFDGSDDYVNTNYDPSNYDEGSISLWLKTTDTASYSGFVSTIPEKGATDPFIRIIKVSGDSVLKVTYRDDNGNTDLLASTTGVDTGEWVHAVYTWKDDKQELYINNINEANGTDTITSIDCSSYPLFIGAENVRGASNNFAPSNIDEVLIYNSTLTQSEITALYNAKFKLDDYSHDNLVSHWDMDGNFNDSVGSNHGTATGAYTTDGLVSYWPLDESLDDLVGGNDGTQSGGVVNATGISSGAMNFDGSGSITLDSDTSLDLSSYSEFGVSLWVEFDDIDANRHEHILRFAGESDGNPYFLIGKRTDNGDSRLDNTFGAMWDNDAASSTSYKLADIKSSWSNNEWHHVFFKYVDNDGYLFLDGQLATLERDVNFAFPSSTNEYPYLSYPSSPLYGSLDEVLIFNRSLDATEITDLYKAGLSQHADTNVTLQTRTADSYNVSDAGLVGLWGLNGDANDETGIHNGTASGAIFNESSGIVGDGGYFDGSGDKITVSDSSALDGSNGFTLSTWANPNSVANGFVAGKQEGSSAYDGYTVMFATGNKISSRIYGNTANAVWSSNYDYAASEWVFLTLTSNGNNEHKLYVNGEYDSNSTTTVGDFTTSVDFTIGERSDGALDFAGLVDEVRLYNRTLTATEIQNLYELGSAHIEWGDWTPTSNIQDGIATTSSTAGKFIQYKDSLLTDNTDVSPRVLNHTIAFLPDSDAPVITLTNPTADYNYSTNITSLNITITDDSGIAACWYNFNGTNSTINFSCSSPHVFEEFNVTEEGVYNVTVYANDTIGYEGSSTINFTIDWTAPSVNLTVPVDNNYTNNGTIDFGANLSDDISGVKNASLWIYWSNGSLFTDPITVVSQTASQVVSTVIELVDDVFTWFVEVFDWSGNRGLSDNRTLTVDLTSPNYTNYTTAVGPNQVSLTNATLDPETVIYVNITVQDPTVLSSTTNISTVYLNYNYTMWNGTEGSDSILMMNNSDVYFTNFTTVPYNATYQYYVSMNDSAGNVNSTTNTTVYNQWDCTWSAYTDNPVNTELNETAGFDEEKNVGTIWLNNTGDYNYSNSNCNILFGFTPTISSSKMALNNSRTTTGFYVGAKSEEAIPINYTFNATVTSSFEYNISIESSVGSGEDLGSQVFAGALLIQQEGPYLSQAASDNDEDNFIYLTPGIINLTGYIKNIMGDGSANNTAYNVTSNWSIPDVFVNASGLLNYSYANISNDSINSQNLEINYTSLANTTKGWRSFSLSSSGYGINQTTNETYNITYSGNNTLLNDSFNLYFACYATSDGFAVWDCLNDDPDTVACGNGYINNKAGVANESCDDGNVVDGDGCDSSCQTEPETISSGGTSSGGGGGGGGASGDKFSKSEGTFELLNGEALEFYFAVENKGDKLKTVGEIFVKGDNADYITIKSGKGKKVSPGEKLNITLEINAPAYFPSGKHLLQFDIVLKDALGTTETVQKFMTLYILDVSRTEADSMLKDARGYLDWMEIRRLDVNTIEALFDSMNEDYSYVSFTSVQSNFEDLEKIVLSAKEFIEFNSSLLDQIDHAKDFDINVFETKKLWLLANVIFNRGDYVLAKQRINEAQSMYAYETKGEFGAVYYARKNPLQAFSALIVLFGIGLFGGFMSRKVYLSRKIKLLKKEEKLLLELMELVQGYTFKDNKMSMGEYYEAMNQYEAKLSKTIAERIKTESALMTLSNLRSKKEALALEKKRLVEMMRDLQDQYLNKGTIETKVYENMLKTYASRLGSVSEELVYLETKKMLRKGGLK
jgi:cysteine-rich repeat protein